jgi:hypothetical protein
MCNQTLNHLQLQEVLKLILHLLYYLNDGTWGNQIPRLILVISYYCPYLVGNRIFYFQDHLH